MTVQRLILETDALGNLKQVPHLPPNQKLEVTILAVGELAGQGQRQPHPDIAGKIKITGDIFDSIPAADWTVADWNISA
jgi:hypothetical protein